MARLALVKECDADSFYRVVSTKKTTYKCVGALLTGYDILLSKEKGGADMATYKAIDVAKWFIARNQTAVDTMGGEKMTLLKLLKLLYYAEGCSLALENGSLFNEDIVAWEHGPVVQEVYFNYPDAYNLSLDDDDMKAVDIINKNETDRNILEQVFDVFGQYSAWALRNKTHEETPWLEATNNGQKLKGIISRETMKKYFQDNYLAS